LDFVHHPVFSITLKNTPFRKPDLFASSGEEVGHTVGFVRKIPVIAIRCL
jgi:hypothetical protein